MFTADWIQLHSDSSAALEGLSEEEGAPGV